MKRKKLPTLTQLRKRADYLWSVMILLIGSIKNPWFDGDPAVAVCGVCGEKPAVSSHHVFHKSMHGRFRYDLRNGLPICRKCHFMERRDPAPVVVRAIGYLGCSAFQDFAMEVMEARGRGAVVRKRKDYDVIIVGLEAAIAETAIPEALRADTPVTV